MPQPQPLTLLEAAYLVRSVATRRERHFAAIVADSNGPTSQPRPPVGELPQPPLVAEGDHAFEDAVDRAFDRLERGLG